MGVSKVVKKTFVNGTEVPVTLIDLTADTITAADLARGKTAHGADGEPIVGTNDKDVDTTSATALVGQVLEGQTFGARGEMLTGTMTNRHVQTSTITTKAQEVAILDGFHESGGTVSIDSTEQAKIIAGNIKDGITILGVLGTYTGAGVTSQTKSATPTWTAQTILPDSGYDYLSEVDVAAIPYVETQNAAGGVTVTIG
jgi:hypothetical protein